VREGETGWLSRAVSGAEFAQLMAAAIDRPDASLAGLVAWYSIINLPDDALPAPLKAPTERARAVVAVGKACGDGSTTARAGRGATNAAAGSRPGACS